MSVKFPLANTKSPGSVYRYDPNSTEPYIEESVITDKNFISAYQKIFETDAKSSSDTYATKVRLNTYGIIIEAEDLDAEDLPPHDHSSNSRGGLIHFKPQFYELSLKEGQTNYALPSEVYSSIFGLYINGLFYTEFTKEGNSEIEISFDLSQDCIAQIAY